MFLVRSCLDFLCWFYDFSDGPIEYELKKKRISLIHKLDPKVSSILYQNGSWNYGYKGVRHIPQISRTGVPASYFVSVIKRIPFFWREGVLTLWKGYSQRIISPADRAARERERERRRRRRRRRERVGRVNDG